MTFEQKLKAAALEAALHPALRHAAKNPARTARNLVEFTAGVAGGLFDDAQKAKLYDAVYPMLQEADREHAARSAASFLLYIFLQSRLFAPLFNITSVCQLLTVLCKPF